MSRRRGFTMIELMVVMVIIGILLGFILMASMNAVRTAQESATRALISKLDSGMTDRLDALLTQRVDPAQLYIGSNIDSTKSAACQFFAFVPRAGVTYTGGALEKSGYQRSAVLARYEQIRHELPDVFVVQPTSGTGPNYPLNYGLLPFTEAGEPMLDYQCVTPLGLGSSTTGFVGNGIWGANYTVHAAINRNLGKWTDAVSAAVGNGVGVKGFDMVDDNGNNLIDDYAEWGGDSDGSIAKALSNHTHVTARAEMLYALLVEGQGPYGSVFHRDDFTDKEVADTDRDGLPEFIDGWGKPLQFYRWPILYHSDVQRGMVSNGTTFIGPYANAFDTREQDALDPNQQLTMPEWWSSALNAIPSIQFSPSGPQSAAVVFFQSYFHLLTEPLANASPTGIGPIGATNQVFWDRSNVNVTPPGSAFASRRAFYNRFLILSGGPDGKLGVPYLTDWQRASDAYGSPSPPFFQTDTAMKSALAGNPKNAALYLGLESQAAQATLMRSDVNFQTPKGATTGDAYTAQIQQDGFDDITNHNMGTTAQSAQ